MCWLPTGHLQDGGGLGDARVYSCWYEYDGSTIAAGVVLARNNSRGAKDTEVLQSLPSY